MCVCGDYNDAREEIHYKAGTYMSKLREPTDGIQADNGDGMVPTLRSRTEGEVAPGNPRLRRMSVLEVRRLLRKALITDPVTKAKWDAYDSEWKERERTYASAQFRAFERGERGGRI